MDKTNSFNQLEFQFESLTLPEVKIVETFRGIGHFSHLVRKKQIILPTSTETLFNFLSHGLSLCIT